jgi:hypothetical protein
VGEQQSPRACNGDARRQGRRIPGTILNSTYLAWAESPKAIEAIGAFRESQVTLTGSGDAARITMSAVTPSMLSILDVQPLRGRIFTAQEGQRNNASFAIISQGLWEQRFGAREDILGQPIVLDGYVLHDRRRAAAQFPFPECRGAGVDAVGYPAD